MRSVANITKLGFATVLVSGLLACQGPEEYFWGALDAGYDVPPVTGLGGATTGAAGSVTGAGGSPTGVGGMPTGLAGTNGAAGTTGNAGSGAPTGAAGTTTGAGGTTGNAGTTGAGGTSSARGGNTGAAGTAASRGGNTGDAGTTGAAGTGGSATNRGGAGGSTGSGGNGGSTASRGGNTGSAGTTGAAGSAGSAASRGGSSGTAGTSGSGTVIFSDDFENETVGSTAASGWSRMGGSSNDWDIATDGTKVLQQANATSSTIRTQAATGASGAPWSGAVSVSARVKLLETGSSNQAALLCVRFNDNGSRYCAALVPNGVQIQIATGGSTAQSAVFSASVTTGTFYDLRLSVDASNLLTVYLGGTQRGTYMPTAIANGFVAVGTTSMMAAFDNISVTRP